MVLSTLHGAKTVVAEVFENRSPVFVGLVSADSESFLATNFPKK